MTIIDILFISMGVTLALIMIIILLLNFTRNFFTRGRYVRIETFNDDKSITVIYQKKSNFNLDNSYILNHNHIFMLKGYTTLIFTEHTRENINPLDFESKYDAKMYETAIKSKVVAEAFSTLKSGKMDMLKIAVIVSMITLSLVLYLILKQQGVM